MYSINCKGKLISIETPLIMGIINATPDSFYKGDILLGMDGIINKAQQMIAEGVDIIDVGGQSTRPNATLLTVQEELERVLPVISTLHTLHPQLIISVDTFYSEVAKQAIAAGASIVNDVSGGTIDEAMLPTVAALQVPYICMHMKGNPQTMQQLAMYDDVTLEVLDFFIKKVHDCSAVGIKDVIIDPGFGFAKTITHNFTLLKNLSQLKILQCPILVGLSRKSTVYKTLNITADEALNGSTVLHTLALENGANILRVHDVKAAKEVVQLLAAYHQ